MTDNIEDAKRLKNEARTNIALAVKHKDFSMFEDALDELAEARRLLLNELSTLNDSKINVAFTSSNLQKLAGEVADCFGISGGAYRRMGKIDEAIEMYDKGYEYEANPDYEIQSSYNLVNRIVLRILENPILLHEMRNSIKEAISILQNQIKSTRDRDWWAWADLGLLRILNYENDLALEAYKKIKSLGPSESNIESMINVLKSLETQIISVDRNLSSSILDCIRFLKQ
jgi:tetratricopeptide (TPR) repeat protein